MIERIKRRLRGEGGTTIVEMLTVMIIMSIVFAGITSVFVAGSKAQADQDRRFQAQVTTRLALDKIRRDIHCANDVTPYATTAVTLKISAGCGGDISWCTAQAGWGHLQLGDRSAVGRLSDEQQRLSRFRARHRVPLPRVASGRFRREREGDQRRCLRAEGHDLPPKQLEDLRR